MKVTFKESEVKFCDLRVGDTFIDKDYDEEAVLLKVEPSLDVDICESSLVEGEYTGYAVDIKGGGIYGFFGTEMVIPVESEVIINRS